MSAIPLPRHRGRLVLFAFGDFAFNLYWQSVMLFLLFYYTDAVHLPVETAALTYMVASIWDGIVNLAAGMLGDRGRRRRIGYRNLLMLGSLPLGLAFILAYLPPPFTGWGAAAAVFAGHMLFRTAYAVVNVSYLAMSARVSQDSGDRALIAGLRMLFGTLALLAVTQGTARIGGWLTGTPHAAAGYFAAAVVFGVAGSLILLAVGLTAREVVPAEDRAGPSLRECLASLAHNRAFVTLNAATVAMIIASAVLTKSVLYYYKYEFGDEAAGAAALGWMGLAAAFAVPVWVIVCRRIGTRATWLAGVALGAALLGGFLLQRLGDTGWMAGFLMAMQVALTGLNIAFWTMLPDTIEYGERSTGLRLEGTVFGLAALIQRISIGAATGLLGLAMSAIGYDAGVTQSPATLEALRLVVGLVPLAALALSALFMLLNPLTRNAHAAIVAELARRRDGVGEPA